MQLLRTDDGTIWLATDYNVAATSDFGLYMALRKRFGDPIPVTPDDVKRFQDDATWRVGELAKAVAAPAAQPANVDAAAVAAAIAGNTDLVKAIAKAAADEVSSRLQS